MDKRLWPSLGAVIAFLALACTLLLAEIIIDGSNSPPPGVDTLAEYQAWRPESSRAVPVVVDGAAFTVVFGDPPTFPIKEFPAAYIFDSQGQLIDWSPEASDIDPLSRHWEAAREELRRAEGGSA